MAMAFSQDSSLLCIVLESGDVHLWEIATGIEREVLHTKRGGASVAFSPDSSLLAIGSLTGGVSLWDLTTLSLLHILEEREEVIEVAFSCGNVVASCFSAIHKWDVNTGVKLHTLKHQDIGRYWYSPRRLFLDCTSIAIYIEPYTIEARDTRTGATKWSLQGNRILRYGQVSPNGNLVVFQLVCGPVPWGLLDVATGKRKGWTSSKFYMKQRPPFRFAFSHDSELVAVSNISRIEIIHIKTWKRLAHRDCHEGTVYHVSFSPNGQLLACRDESSVSLWDITTCERWRMSGSGTQGVMRRLSSVNGNMFELSNNGLVFWDPKTHRSRTMKSPRKPFDRIALSLDGKIMASANATGRVYLCDTGTGALKHTFHAKVEKSRVAIAPNGEFVAFAPASGVVSIWNSTTGRRHNQVLSQQSSEYHAWRYRGHTMIFSPDSRLMALGSSGGAVCIWGIKHDTACARTEFHHSRPGNIIALAFSPDAKLLASGSLTNTIHLWDTTTGTKRWASQSVLRRVAKRKGSMFVAFSHDGEVIASALDDHPVILWHAKSGTIQQTITTGACLHCLSFFGTDILTDRGALPLADNSQSIFVSEDWIMVGRQGVVYIPPDYRDSLAFVSGDIIGFLDSSGQIQTICYNRP